MPSPDTRAEFARFPDKPGSVAFQQFEIMTGAPYTRTSDEILSSIMAERKSVPEEDLPEFKEAFHAKGQPCMRLSPLVKSHGWAIHHDNSERVALVDPDSARFRELMEDENVKKIDGMRIKRRPPMGFDHRF